MEMEKFEKLVNQAIEEIPKNFLARLENVQIVIEDEPNSQQRRKLRMRKGSLLLGLYEGVPMTRRWSYGQVLPDKITIFKKPIEQISHGFESRIKELVKETVWHEIAHHFGMNESRVKKAELRRKNNP